MSLTAQWQSLTTWLHDRAWSQSVSDEEAPLRSELFSADQLEQHGKLLAATHQLASERAPDLLLARLADNERVLIGVCKLLTPAVASKYRVTPAGEWLLDNFYLIEEQIRTAQRHLPKGYSRELPVLAGMATSRYPRVYGIALEIIAHGDGRIDPEGLRRFLAAYQTVTVLKLGELWAVPIMLRLAIIENLRRVGVRVATGWRQRNLADTWADRMTLTAATDPKSLILEIADMARSQPPMSSAFVAEITRRLQGRGPALALPLTWIEQHLAESGQTIAQLVQQENQRQAAAQVSISNSIASLRLLGAVDWREFVETMSAVDQTLRNDPDGVYGRMDFATRDRYRHAAEAIAKRGHLSEGAVAQLALALATTAANRDPGAAAERKGHVGYYLIGDGLGQLEEAAGMRLQGWSRFQRSLARKPLCAYLGAITVLTIGIAALPLLSLQAYALPTWQWLPLTFLVLLASSQLGGALVNWLATLLVDTHPLPRMDFSAGIPMQSRTLVVVPTMLGSRDGLERLVEALEVRYLANRDAWLHFGLLTDFLDAAEETLPGDAALLQLATVQINALNQKYANGHGDLFFLFHRPRQWNPQEGRWIAAERKRGKLAALNALLQTGSTADFSLVVGNPQTLAGVRYVITLDTDTQLPRDAARQFVGAMAHPLNRPYYDPVKQRVTAGHAILQPRVAISLPGTNRSRHARLYGGEPGLDPYTRAISDVYQDVFGEGSFIGKGIYDVDAFEQALGGRFPDNRILSHDLLEGCYARSALLSDVELYEDGPASYRSDLTRRTRWIRGDWQLVGWLLSRIPAARPGMPRPANPLSGLAQWKLYDNLRRSLIPATLTLLLLIDWLAPSQLLPVVGVLTLTVLGIVWVPTACATLLDLLKKPEDAGLRPHLAAVAVAANRRCQQLVFELACLPHESLVSLGAIARTGWRMLVSHRHLLEWNPSSEADRTAAANANSLLSTLRNMWIGPTLATVVGLTLATVSPGALPIAAPLLLLWLLSPAIAWWISLPLPRRKAALSTAQTRFLHTLARRTWAFFDQFVGPEDHWLPPDNYQEYRVGAIAHRTSPTNIGLSLLANLAAYDFGYLTAGALLTRTGNTLDTMQRLERHRGHFYNWYDTQTLAPLPPIYLSTVDSGNLAGHLLTLRAGLTALADAPLLPPRLFAGLADTLSCLNASLSSQEDKAAISLTDFEQALETATMAAPAPLAARRHHLVRLLGLAEKIAVPSAAAHLPETTDPHNEARDWQAALVGECQAALAELQHLAPWLLLPSPPAGLTASLAKLPAPGTLGDIAGLSTVSGAINDALSADERAWLFACDQAINQGRRHAGERLASIALLAEQLGEMAEMEYDFLYDKTQHLLSIGYNLSERRMDPGYYDLLASEARLCSFVAIAQGALPQENWFALGRLLTATGGDPVLLSWSGSMFEYLMPQLVMPNYENTLLDQTGKAAVARQIEYGKQRGVPWGMSESAYNTVDQHLNYQYRAFGVPGLGLKRGLAEDLVVAPYASVLALMVAPEAACVNLQRLAKDGLLGRFGLFEAIDYTPARQRRGQSSVIVRAFMAHHQGMSLLALAYLLLDQPMQRRFASDRRFQAVMLLLQERIPKTAALFTHTAQVMDTGSAVLSNDMPVRMFKHADTPMPEVQLLSNGRYHVMVSQAGGGYSRWNELAVTRWREDGTRDHWGSFCYLRDVDSGVFWSNMHQPTLQRPERYEAIFTEGRAEFRRCDALGEGDARIESHTDIVVSPEDDIELRRIRLTNRSRLPREIEITSYAEVVIAAAAAEIAHPAFSNLFVQSEILRDRHAILCTRRPRSLGEQTPWMLHLAAVHGAETLAVSYETDRARFIGRTRSSASPLALITAGPLSDSEGSVLDPVVAIRTVLRLLPDQTATIDLVTGMAESREQALALIEKHQDRHLADRVFDLAWTHNQVVLRQLNASEADAQLYARLASAIIYADSALRAEAAVLIRNLRGQSGLWGYAISGDLPIVLLQIADAANVDLVRQLVQAHAYWRLKGLVVDLVIWNEDHAGYRQQLQEQILALVALGVETSIIDRPGGIFVRQAEQISHEDRLLFQAVARVVISDGQGSLVEQLDRRRQAEVRPPRFVATRSHRPETVVPQALPPLQLANPLGGFSPDGSEYVITLAPGQTTPAPWCNVLANADFGCVITESGSAYTWSENAHEFRLTPWHNDPVSDAGGEALYLRDEDSGRYWSPTPSPACADGIGSSYVIRHGFGYSVFTTVAEGIASELWVYVGLDSAIKFSLLKIHNLSERPRRLSATAYVEWVLGDLRGKSAMHVNTAIDPINGTICARNPYHTEFAERVAWLDVDDAERTFSGDRNEFIGRNGNLRQPAAMGRTRLSGKVGAGLDPCAAIQVPFTLAAGEQREVIFRLGAGHNSEDAGQLLARYRGSSAAHTALQEVRDYWRHTLGAVRIETPDPTLDVLANGWLVYQTQACRLWARSGFYQSGGAYGFRDQLQDVMALTHCSPALVREHLLRAARRQFVEGDVQHWWHPPAGRGVRTRCSDDYLWLPLAVARYVTVTGDHAVLEESLPFLEGRPVNPDDDSYYDLPGHSAETATLYQHCVRAIRHGLRTGSHGLPLMGSGDWNDGMNLVGIHGRGESVWLAFFLVEVLQQFSVLVSARGDSELLAQCQHAAGQLRENIEAHGWDGEWYRRAYFDDGTPLGSAANAECRIDSIAQSWSVLSGAAEPTRARQAMAALKQHLLRPEDGLMQLLDPPFDQSSLDPGYIRGYLPGVRENGGQYTHGAVWAAMAFAALGEGEQAWALCNMINPVNHALSPQGVATYKAEPYVLAADVYGVAPHTGRAGWSWYTGSAGWMYRLITESLLGINVEGETLQLTPCLPAAWPGCTLYYRYRATTYHLHISALRHDARKTAGLWLDGRERHDKKIPLVDDQREHVVELWL